jgi:hypothetical protein
MRAVAGRGDDGRRDADCERAGRQRIHAPVETALSNMEAELRSHWPDVRSVYLTQVAAHRPDDEESSNGGDETA